MSYRKVSEILGILGILGRDDNYLLFVCLPWTDDGEQRWCVHLRENGKNYRFHMLEILEISQVPTAGRWQMTFGLCGGLLKPVIFSVFPYIIF
jgi:hypothetical protein